MQIGIALALAAAHAATPAQTAWPERPVRIVVPYAPGGTTDFAARTIAEKLTAQTGKSFFVENKSGASGTIGTAQVAKSRPDGYTLLANDTTYAMLPSPFAKLPWDHANDLGDDDHADTGDVDRGCQFPVQEHERPARARAKASWQA